MKFFNGASWLRRTNSSRNCRTAWLTVGGIIYSPTAFLRLRTGSIFFWSACEITSSTQFLTICTMAYTYGRVRWEQWQRQGISPSSSSPVCCECVLMIELVFGGGSNSVSTYWSISTVRSGWWRSGKCTGNIKPCLIRRASFFFDGSFRCAEKKQKKNFHEDWYFFCTVLCLMTKRMRSVLCFVTSLFF